MSGLVSTLVDVSPGGGRYVFLLVAWNDYADRVRDELNRQADAFGLDLGPRGTFVQPYPQRRYEIAEEVLGKPWPGAIRDRFTHEQDPMILILDRGWREFVPADDPYAIVWLSDFDQEPSRIGSLLGELARRTRDGEDVIAYLAAVARTGRRGRGVGRVARIASYFEVKPQVFGVAVDVKAILQDIARRRPDRPA